MPTEFIEVPSGATIPAEAIQFLQDSIESPPHLSELTIDDIVEGSASGMGLVSLAIHEGELAGAIYYVLGVTIKGNVLNLALMGGTRLDEWKQALFDYSVALHKRLGCVDVLIMSRPGWGRLFPDLKIVGHIYSLR